jgi:hypothetical protein
MHSLITSTYQETAGALVRLRSDPDLSIVACISARNATPYWIAKVSSTRSGIERLRRERDVLEHLRPWSGRLGVPVVIGSADDSNGFCFIQEGVSGVPLAIRLDFRSIKPSGLRLQGGLNPWLERLLQWLEEFQTLVPPPRPCSVADLVTGSIPSLESVTGDAFALRLRAIGAQIDPVTLRSTPLVAAHGDFCCGNILVSGRTFHVIDWNGFEAGSPLEDLFNCLVKCESLVNRRPATPQQTLSALLFAPEIRLLLSKAADRFCLTREAARGCLYLYLLRRACWELGYGSRPRTASECASAAQEWAPVLAWLEAEDYPDPWSSTHLRASQKTVEHALAAIPAQARS